MSLISPEIEIVEKDNQSLRYLEHGWPSDLCRWHAHQEYELHLILDTRGKAFVGDYIGEFKPGSLFLVGPNLPHNWITDDIKAMPTSLRDMLVQFSEANMRHLYGCFPEFKEIKPMLDLSRSGIEFTGFDQSIARSAFEMMRDTQGSARIIGFLQFLLALNAHSEKKILSLVQVIQQERNSKQARIGAIVDYIVSQYSETLTLEDAATRACMSVSSFSRNFKTVTGHNFVEFLNRVRIGQACSMLYATDAQVSAICYDVGFQNLANFNRQFLKMKNMTPSVYRETARRDLAVDRSLGGCVV